jgi:hypothetical protein
MRLACALAAKEQIPMARSARRARAWIAIGAVAVAAAAIGLWLVYPRERDLMALARPVVALDTTATVYGEPKEAAYWLSADQALLTVTDRAREPLCAR